MQKKSVRIQNKSIDQVNLKSSKGIIKTGRKHTHTQTLAKGNTCLLSCILICKLIIVKVFTLHQILDKSMTK